MASRHAKIKSSWFPSPCSRAMRVCRGQECRRLPLYWMQVAPLRPSTMAVNVSERELLARMRNFEDHFVERKTSSDLKDCLKTIVAFANSTPIDSYSILFIGVRNSGEIEPPKTDFDKLQRAMNERIAKIQPRIEYLQRIVSEGGRQALAVVIPYSSKRPHYSGPAFVRRGSESLQASSDELEQMIQSRNPKVAHILAHKGEHVYVVNSLRTPHGPSESYWGGTPHIYDCNGDFITIGNGAEARDRQTFPLSQIDIE
jgi:Putative DNA-binding domain